MNDNYIVIVTLLTLSISQNIATSGQVPEAARVQAGNNAPNVESPSVNSSQLGTQALKTTENPLHIPTEPAKSGIQPVAWQKDIEQHHKHGCIRRINKLYTQVK